MTGDTFVQSWLIWGTFHTTGEHLFHQKFSLLSSDLKNVLANDFPMQPFANVLQIRCYCKFPDNYNKYLCWSLFLIHVLIKLQDLWPATLLKKRPQHRCFPVNVLKCLKNTFYGTPPVAGSENGFEEFLKAVFHGTICMIYLIWTCKLRNRANVLHWNVDDTVLKRLDEFYLFRLIWNEEIKQTRVTQIVLYKWFRVKPP